MKEIYGMCAVALIGSTAGTAELKGGTIRLALLVAVMASGWGLVWLIERRHQNKIERERLITKRLVERAEWRKRQIENGYIGQVGTKSKEKQCL